MILDFVHKVDPGMKGVLKEGDIEKLDPKVYGIIKAMLLIEILRGNLISLDT